MSAKVFIPFIKKKEREKKNENCKRRVKVLLGFKALLVFWLPLKSDQITKKTQHMTS